MQHPDTTILEADMLVQSALDSLKSAGTVPEASFDSGYCTSPVRLATGMKCTQL